MANPELLEEQANGNAWATSTMTELRCKECCSCLSCKRHNCDWDLNQVLSSACLYSDRDREASQRSGRACLRLRCMSNDDSSSAEMGRIQGEGLPAASSERFLSIWTSSLCQSTPRLRLTFYHCQDMWVFVTTPDGAVWPRLESQSQIISTMPCWDQRTGYSPLYFKAFPGVEPVPCLRSYTKSWSRLSSRWKNETLVFHFLRHYVNRFLNSFIMVRDILNFVCAFKACGSLAE